VNRTGLTRRDFSQLAAAAMSGIVAGSLAMNLSGCSQQPMGTTPAKTSGGSAGTEAKMAGMDMHACAGMNGCKGQGMDAKNACAGQGGCASKAMHHECKGQNACKGQGGCGEMAGENMCKGQGGCAVPMKDATAWQKAREKFEMKMKAAGKEVGPAPAKS
jgi:hypothetical protein